MTMAIVVYWTLTCYNISSNSCDISNLFARKPSEHLNDFNKNFCFPYWLLVDKNAICYEYPFIHGQSYNNLTFKQYQKCFAWKITLLIILLRYSSIAESVTAAPTFTADRLTPVNGSFNSTQDTILSSGTLRHRVYHAGFWYDISKLNNLLDLMSAIIHISFNYLIWLNHNRV